MAGQVQPTRRNPRDAETRRTLRDRRYAPATQLAGWSPRQSRSPDRNSRKPNRLPPHQAKLVNGCDFNGKKVKKYPVQGIFW